MFNFFSFTHELEAGFPGLGASPVVNDQKYSKFSHGKVFFRILAYI